jgi:hypothetical protein
MATTLKQLEEAIAATEAAFDAVAGDRIVDCFVAARIGKSPPRHLLNEWLGQYGLNPTGTLYPSLHRVERDVLLVSLPNFKQRLPEGWLPVDAPFFEGERTAHWAHRGLNATYQAWLASR